jgi:ribosome-associated protein
MADDLRVNGSLTIPATELTEKFTVSGGPGGQHANRSNTRVELTFDALASEVLTDFQRRRITAALGAEVRVVVDEHRSQTRNRVAARDRLAEKIASTLTIQKARRKTKPSRGSQKRRLDKKKQRSELKSQRRRPDDY